MATSGLEQAARVDDDGTIHLAPQTIPLPKSISEVAREVLATPRAPERAIPSFEDKDGWRQYARDTDELFASGVERALQACEGRSTVETTTIAGVTVHVATPTNLPEQNRGRAWITVHGGGFVNLAGAWARAEAALMAAEWSTVAYGVDYRVPPDHPYPVPVDDVVAVYRQLIERYEPQQIVLYGTSAGGNLIVAATLKARDQGLAVPGALIVGTPEADLTESGDTFETLRYLDGRLPVPIPDSIALYADGHDLRDPYLSPVFADFSPGFPPTYIQSGTRDLFLSNSVRLHRALRNAGMEAELHVWEAAPHGGFFQSGAPEATEELAEQARFLAKYLGDS